MSESQRLNFQQYMDQAKRSLDNQLRGGQSGRSGPNQDTWEGEYPEEPSHFARKLLPKHTAMIFGDRHVMTFDGKVYSIPEGGRKCAYLMARGNKKENFALVKTHDGKCSIDWLIDRSMCFILSIFYC